MYLQFHRGIFTSQSRTKRGNRRNESLLVEAEAWCAQATLLRGVEYPHDDLDELWEQVLLLQFHDILPGSSIAWVHREAEATHARVTARLEELVDGALTALAGPGGRALTANPATEPVAGIPALGIGEPKPDADVRVVERLDGSVELTSEALTVLIAADGTVASIVESESGRELIAEGRRGNLLQLHVDAPAKWDAWELDRSYRLSTTDLTGGVVRVEGREVVVEREFGRSSVTQRIGLDVTGAALLIHTDVDWHERHRLLKLAFPLDVHAADAAYETSFGHLRRPTHANTSWDAARYESCAHRYVHVGEPGFGVAVVNDAVYGHDVTRDSDDGRVVTTVRQSLLRAPTYPDPDADQGRHSFVTLVAPAPTVLEAAHWGAVIGSPARAIVGAEAPEPLVSLEGGSARLSSVKLAADRGGDVVVRVYEAQGSRTRAVLRVGFPLAGARLADLVETPGGEILPEGDSITLDLRPFEVRTLLLHRK
ncbi:glycoside hydrolase family 38 C-terminal domain-containing protein [Tessaracoccus coleopterorum]|uniref:glycoside hydrolase family 38 C-terminal domain-containing protein n=1 Tax=Tessaracoccus coleopterorum TaxID=2714950 RepID=UPI0018D2F167|nr:glycoside hydrolase family 38 C-terminal domain-containing protein [Tessaracoccus coleopterorum]